MTNSKFRRLRKLALKLDRNTDRISNTIKSAGTPERKALFVQAHELTTQQFLNTLQDIEALRLRKAASKAVRAA